MKLLPQGGRQGRESAERMGEEDSTPTSRPSRRKPPSSNRSSAGKLPENWDADLPKWKPDDKPIATRVGGRRGHQCARQTHPQSHRRLGRSESVHQHRAEGAGRFPAAGVRRAGDAGRGGRRMGLRGPQHSVRRSRACHGRGGERNGGAWRRAAFQRHVPGVLRLHEAVDPAGRVEQAEGVLRLHARQRRRGRRWTDA